MSANDNSKRILDAVDAGFDAQLATTKDFVAIPSTRGAMWDYRGIAAGVRSGNGAWA